MERIGTGVLRMIVFAASVCIWAACTHPSTISDRVARITVTISPLPESYHPARVTWHLAWWDGAAVQSRTLPEQAATVDTSVTLPLSRQGAEVVVVHATAHPQGGGALAPLGGWGTPSDSRVAPEADFGRTAGVVLQVARRGLDPALINLARLEQTVVEECGDQPESLDYEKLVAALGTGEITRYGIRRRRRPECEVSLPAPGDDVWISHDTTEETIEGVWADDRCYWVIPVAEGEVRHLWQWSSARRLTVGRDRDGHAFWFISPLH
ncbi:MAG: hypothetical protein ACOCYB_00080 [Alkalispirochaeta sp.]